jgi:hypothetical protein
MGAKVKPLCPQVPAQADAYLVVDSDEHPATAAQVGTAALTLPDMNARRR